MVAGFVSENPGTTQDDISDYVASNVKDTLSRLNGVGDLQLFGAQYAMRIWLDADLLNKYKLTPVDVINQLKVQNCLLYTSVALTCSPGRAFCRPLTMT